MDPKKQTAYVLLRLLDAFNNAMSWFSGKIDGASDFRDKDFGEWKLASQEAEFFSGGHALFDLLMSVNLWQPNPPITLLTHTTDFLAEISPVTPPDTGMGQLAATSGAISDVERQFVYQTNDAADVRRCSFNRSGDQLSEVGTRRVAPSVIGPFDIQERLSQDKLQFRRIKIANAFQANEKEGPRTNLTYLEEAYYFVPIQLGLQQQSEYPTAALDWFRTTYDYGASKASRKIYYGLAKEHSEPAGYQRAENWLLDPLNPHEIPRRDKYTHFTLLTIVRRMLDYADTKFTRDDSESDERARLLYLTTLQLLNSDELRQSPGGCADLIGQINIRVGHPVLQAIVSAMRYELAGIGNTLTLSNLIDEVKAKLGAEEPWNERIAQAHQLVVDAKNAFPPPPTLQKVVEGKAVNAGANSRHADDRAGPCGSRRTRRNIESERLRAHRVADIGDRRRGLRPGQADDALAASAIGAAGDSDRHAVNVAQGLSRPYARQRARAKAYRTARATSTCEPCLGG
jgi:hypothetical protein